MVVRMTFGRSATRRTVSLACAGGLAWAFAVGAPGASAQTAEGVSNVAILWVAVSHAYQSTGLVVAEGQPLSGCGSGCQEQLWASHDGGHSWIRPKATGWSGGHIVIATDARGHDTLFSQAKNDIERSDDGGDTWTAVGSVGGVPAPMPSYAKDASVAVAGSKDYLLQGASTKSVPGSAGAMYDNGFAFSPGGDGGAAPLLSGISTSGNTPAIERCDSHLRCSGMTQLTGTKATSGAPNLFPSTTFGQDGVAFAQTTDGVYKSTDGGHSFLKLAVGVPTATSTAISMMALAPSYSETGGVKTAYAGVLQLVPGAQHPQTSGGLYRTTDGGATWIALDSPGGPFDQGAFSVAVAPDGRIFASNLTMKGQAGLYCSTDGGSTWQATCPSVGHGDPGLPPGQTPIGKASTACSGSACSASQGTGTGSGAPSSPGAGAGGTAGGTGSGTSGGKGGTQLVGHAGTESPGRPWLLPGIIATVLLGAAWVGRTLFDRRRRAVAD